MNLDEQLVMTHNPTFSCSPRKTNWHLWIFLIFTTKKRCLIGIDPFEQCSKSLYHSILLVGSEPAPPVLGTLFPHFLMKVNRITKLINQPSLINVHELYQP